MAIYEYDCAGCGKRIEVMQSMSAAPLVRCGDECVARPRNGKGKLTRVLSRVNVGGGAAGSGPDPGADRNCGTCGRTGPDVCDS